MPIMDMFKSDRRRMRIVCLPLIFLTLSINLGNAKPINITKYYDDQSQSPSTFIRRVPPSSFGSAERLKRQLFREEIPHHRPLSGNLYAIHHGYPHPGRWHANQQSIVPPNYDSGLHFDNPNVILNDRDFNRYGSTLQHIDDHRIATNPAPILHEYPTEFGKIVNLGSGSGGGGISHSSHSMINSPVPLIATHHHINNNHGGTSGFIPSQYDTVQHGHAVIHHGVSGNHYDEQKYSPPKSKPYFGGMKIPHLFSYKTFNVPPIIKNLFPGRYGHGHGGGGAGGGGFPYKRKGAQSYGVH